MKSLQKLSLLVLSVCLFAACSEETKQELKEAADAVTAESKEQLSEVADKAKGQVAGTAR
jgi:TRAP-type C4-dicarboxylate transport system substrate-binding protein